MNVSHNECLSKFMTFIHDNNLYGDFNTTELSETLAYYTKYKRHICACCYNINEAPHYYKLSCGCQLCASCMNGDKRRREDDENDFQCQMCLVETDQSVKIDYPDCKVFSKKRKTIVDEFQNLHTFRHHMEEIVTRYPKKYSDTPTLRQKTTLRLVLEEEENEEIKASAKRLKSEEMTRRFKRRANRGPSEDWSD